MTAKKTPAQDLPPDVLAADLKYPELGKFLPYAKQQELGLETTRLTFYKTKGGWMLTTLAISNARRGSSFEDRTYAIGVADSKIYTVGGGPHVLTKVEVILTIDNVERLAKYIELWKKGMAEAGSIRDRISSRRAQGQLHRAAGRTSWRW